MSADTKQQALKDLEMELIGIQAERDAIEKRHSLLQQTIAGLRGLLDLNGALAPSAKQSHPLARGLSEAI